MVARCVFLHGNMDRFVQDPNLEIHGEIIEQARKGVESAFEKLYRLYHRSMYNTALRITANRTEAEDVLQESFINAFKNLNSFRGDSTFGAWLKRIVVNNSLNAIRKNNPERWTDEMDQIPDEIFSQERSHFPFSVAQVHQAILQLADGYRTVLSLYLIEGYDHEEISQILKIDENTSKSQLSRAKKKLIQLLNQNYKRNE